MMFAGVVGVLGYLVVTEGSKGCVKASVMARDVSPLRFYAVHSSFFFLLLTMFTSLAQGRRLVENVIQSTN